ncbi:hypothetical protein FHR50_000954 [Xanthomonas arboricola]
MDGFTACPASGEGTAPSTDLKIAKRSRDARCSRRCLIAQLLVDQAESGPCAPLLQGPCPPTIAGHAASTSLWLRGSIHGATGSGDGGGQGPVTMVGALCLQSVRSGFNNQPTSHTSTSGLTASSGPTPRPRRCNRLRLMARHLQSCGMTARPAARDSAWARLQSVGVAFGRHVVVCRAVLVGRGEDCTMAFASFNGRFFRMSRDVASPPGEFVHRSGFIAANTATWSHAAGYVLHVAHLATSLRVAGMDLPHQPLLSPACDGQP